MEVTKRRYICPICATTYYLKEKPERCYICDCQVEEVDVKEIL